MKKLPYSKMIMLILTFLWSYLSARTTDGDLFVFRIGCIVLVLMIGIIIAKTKPIYYRVAMYVLLSIVAILGLLNSKLEELAGYLAIFIVLYPICLAITMEFLHLLYAKIRRRKAPL